VICMDLDKILKTPSMPAISPSYPPGPYRFVNREYFIIRYQSDPIAIREVVPVPLEPAPENQVYFEWIAMPDASGFGSYTESGCVIPCSYRGQEVNFTVQMYLNDEPPISAGREIWGFPKKFGHPRLEVVEDTLTGTLVYAGQTVAVGTMGYKHLDLSGELDAVMAILGKTQVNLKLIPGADGKAAIAQLVAYNLCDVTLKGAWSGPARLHLVPHVNAPVADLPVIKVIEGRHAIADLTLPYGIVLYDYLA
jgi:acetoacetate decarboxylase